MRLFGFTLSVLLICQTLLAEESEYHHDHVLGTSLDLTIWARDAASAQQVERIVLDEVERLRLVLSTYDPASEISQLISAGRRECSAELIEVLRAYEAWHDRSGGAYNARVGELIDIWRQAQQSQRLPDESVLLTAAGRIASPAWRIDGRTVTMLCTTKLSLDSLGKGHIITKAVEAASRTAGIDGMMLNIGGDIRMWQRDERKDGVVIGIADPFHSADNAQPLARVRLGNVAISTSAGYERGYDIAGRHYSHILDARTGQSASRVASATVIARDNVTANALATTICALGPDEGLRLAKSLGNVQCLIVAADGRQLRTPLFAAMELPMAAAAEAPQVAAVEAWSSQLSMTITLKTPTGRRKPQRPYVAIWIEDEKGNPVRTISVWGNERKYLKDLPGWWRFAKDKPDLVRAVTRASRPAGKYTLVWDGLDDAGKAVAPGTYKVNIEANREHGRRVIGNASITCEQVKASAVVKESAEWQDVPLTYGPKSEQQ